MFVVAFPYDGGGVDAVHRGQEFFSAPVAAGSFELG
jgi:hypothetical protein